MGPVGVYVAHEVGRLAGVSGTTIGQWARHGYIRSSQSSETPRVYSYQDVGEAMVVHELLIRKVPHRRIQDAIAQLREQYGDWPLTEAELWVPEDSDSPPIVVRTEVGPTELVPRKGQVVLGQPQLRLIAKTLSKGGWAAKENPELQHIEINPQRLSGRPVIKGTRVPAELVGDLSATEAGKRSLLEDYGLNEDQINDARIWWRTVQGYEEVAA